MFDTNNRDPMLFFPVLRPDKRHWYLFVYSGIGERLSQKIEEIATTGHLQRLEEAGHDPMIKALEFLIKIHGVGSKTVKNWYADGVRTYPGGLGAGPQETNRSSEVLLFPEKEAKSVVLLRRRRLDDAKKRSELTSVQKVSIEHYDDFNVHMPRSVVEKHYTVVKEALQKIDTAAEAIPMGSFRRGQPDCGDIDIIITKRNANLDDLTSLLHKLVKRLESTGFITCSLSGSRRDQMVWSIGDTWGPLLELLMLLLRN